jgi:hypothetical protein
MLNTLRCPRSGSASVCAICQEKFGLVRYYYWRIPLCSKECRDRIRFRGHCDRKWLCIQID